MPPNGSLGLSVTMLLVLEGLGVSLQIGLLALSLSNQLQT